MKLSPETVAYCLRGRFYCELPEHWHRYQPDIWNCCAPRPPPAIADDDALEPRRCDVVLAAIAWYAATNGSSMVAEEHAAEHLVAAVEALLDVRMIFP
jgi:hypothetical protein